MSRLYAIAEIIDDVESSVGNVAREIDRHILLGSNPSAEQMRRWFDHLQTARAAAEEIQDEVRAELHGKQPSSADAIGSATGT